MDTLESAAGAEKQPNMRVGVCWECGEKLLCNEYIVCCTGTIFHICPKCEEKTQSKAEESDSETVPRADHETGN